LSTGKKGKSLESFSKRVKGFNRRIREQRAAKPAWGNVGRR